MVDFGLAIADSGKEFLKINQSETKVSMAAMFVVQSERKEANLRTSFHKYFRLILVLFVLVVSEGEIFKVHLFFSLYLVTCHFDMYFGKLNISFEELFEQIFIPIDQMDSDSKNTKKSLTKDDRREVIAKAQVTFKVI